MRQIPFVALALSLGFASFTATGASPAANPPATTVPIKILDTRVNSFDDASKSYAINRELGRAWIEVTLTVQPSGDDSVAPDVIRVQVPGLGFDAAASAVVFRANDGQAVKCAQVTQKQRLFSKQDVIEPTGHCELIRKYVTVPIDDGFVVEQVQRFEVHFKASHTPSASKP